MNQEELDKQPDDVPPGISNRETGVNCPAIDALFEECRIINVSINDRYGV